MAGRTEAFPGTRERSVRTYDLRTHYELRKTRPLAAREACARVFSLEGELGLVDASGALWPVEALCDTRLSHGDVLRARLRFGRSDGGDASCASKYEDFGFECKVDTVLERVECNGAWNIAGISAPGLADARKAIAARSEANARGVSAGTLYLESSAGKRAVLVRARGLALARTRDWFENRGFLSCETPSLVPSGGVETYLNTFATEYVDHRGTRIALALPTSPEFALKKLLVEGHPRVFQLARAFRNGGELARWHEPEFVMLEWYRAGASMKAVMTDTRALVDALAAALGSLRTLPAAHDVWPEFTVESLFRQHAGIELEGVTDVAVFRAVARASSRVVSSIGETDDWDTVFFKVFLDAVEPFLATLPACFVTRYPARMGALAANVPAGEGPYVQRFEAYLFGVEICNGYLELTDASEASLRFSRIEADRGEATKRDPVFESALAYGLPPSAGNALGVDRVCALLLGLDGIASLFCVPFLSQFPQGTVAPD